MRSVPAELAVFEKHYVESVKNHGEDVEKYYVEISKNRSEDVEEYYGGKHDSDGERYEEVFSDNASRLECSSRSSWECLTGL